MAIASHQKNDSEPKQHEGKEGGSNAGRDKRAGRKRKADAEPEAVTPVPKAALPKTATASNVIEKSDKPDGRSARRAAAAAAAAATAEEPTAQSDGRPEPRSKRLKVRLGFSPQAEIPHVRPSSSFTASSSVSMPVLTLGCKAVYRRAA